ncbi:PTS sugar transporter subunit IIA [Maridesulfovibrio bastinii]|uniref:PTS sugar transporter subunit IIA n=1 Tax=Maridesulfovibrio bastinii TaxID=47157 RepID=UPI00042274D0|nr:PTS sugar transporter subunit IIA [Maridesulfovibrio bastinii]
MSETAGSNGIVIVTHGDFGKALIKAAELIVGPIANCVGLSVDVSEGMDAAVDSIKKAVAEVKSGLGVLILTDMFGGTPSNLSLSFLSDEVEVVSGVNLPVLLKALQRREDPLHEMAEQALQAGIKGIVVAGEMLRKRKKG